MGYPQRAGTRAVVATRPRPVGIGLVEASRDGRLWGRPPLWDERSKRMARSYPNGTLSTVAANGFFEPIPRAGRWVTGLGRGLRLSVLPEHPAEDAETVATPAAGSPLRPAARLARRAFPALLTTLLLLAIGLVVFRVAFADRVYPAVVVGDVPVGGLTIAAAESRLADRAADLERGTIAFSFDDQTWMPTLSELGVTVLLDSALTEAQLLGRDDNPTARIAFLGEILDADQVVPLRTRIDQATLDAWFDRVDREMDRLPVNATIALKDMDVRIVPGERGTVVDREAATALILTALETLEPVAVELPTQVAEPEVGTADLEAVKADVEELISKPVKATYGDESWTIEPETVVPYLTAKVVVEDGVPAAKLSVDTEGLTAELRETYAAEVSRKPVDAVLSWSDGLVVVEPSQKGAALRSAAFAEAVAESYLSGHKPVKIPVVVIDPTIDDTQLDRLGIKERLGSGHSNYEGGTWERDENIRVSTELMDGTLVAPGETFSFNGAIGEITSAKGYQEALVVVGEQVGRDVGGGVCQLSTTVFRAAINAGMPIVEWYPHSFRLPNYERDGWGPGFDASILQSGPNPETWADFRFQNYTDSWLLVESSMTDSRVYVDIYGTSDGRDIEIDTWQISDKAFAFKRVIYDRKGEVIADRTFETAFIG